MNPTGYQVLDQETLSTTLFPAVFVKSADKTESNMYFILRGYLLNNFHIEKIHMVFNIKIKYIKHKKKIE
jgi:hypothetical protein